MTRRFILLVVSMALLAPATTSATARVYTGKKDLGIAWAQFMHKDAVSEPVMEFPYEHCFRRSALSHNLPVVLLLALARGESDFDPNAKSHANAHGLMQILWPDTAKDLGFTRLSQLYEPCANVDAGARYLKELLGRYDGDLHLALAAYNYGPRRIRQGAAIPKGAEWYSGYIYQHLAYVMGERNRPRRVGDSGLRYSDEGRVALILFGEPYRADAFVQTLRASAPDIRLDWFRRDIGEYQVRLLYSGREDFRRSVSRLRAAGFPVTAIDEGAL